MRSGFPVVGASVLPYERRLAESNRCTRLCRPLPSHSVKAPRGRHGTSASSPALPNAARPAGRTTRRRSRRSPARPPTAAGGCSAPSRQHPLEEADRALERLDPVVQLLDRVTFVLEDQQLAVDAL